MEKEKVKNRFEECFRKCEDNPIDAGLTKEEVLVITDGIVGGLGRRQVSLLK